MPTLEHWETLTGWKDSRQEAESEIYQGETYDYLEGPCRGIPVICEIARFGQDPPQFRMSIIHPKGEGE